MKLKHNLRTIRETLEKSNSALETLEEIGRCEAELRERVKKKQWSGKTEWQFIKEDILDIK